MRIRHATYRGNELQQFISEHQNDTLLFENCDLKGCYLENLNLNRVSFHTCNMGLFYDIEYFQKEYPNIPIPYDNIDLLDECRSHFLIKDCKFNQLEFNDCNLIGSFFNNVTIDQLFIDEDISMRVDKDWIRESLYTTRKIVWGHTTDTTDPSIIANVSQELGELIVGTVLTEALFTTVTAPNIELNNFIFKRVGFTNCMFEDSEFTLTLFNNCQFNGTSCYNSWFINCTFKETEVFGGNFEDCGFLTCVFDHSKFSTSLVESGMTNCVIVHSDFVESDIFGLVIEDLRIDQITYEGLYEGEAVTNVLHGQGEVSEVSRVPRVNFLSVQQLSDKEFEMIQEEERVYPICFDDLVVFDNSTGPPVKTRCHEDEDGDAIHVFHEKCLLAYKNSGTRNSKLCPLCRKGGRFFGVF